MKTYRDIGIPFAVSSARYEARLDSGMRDSLPLTGKLRIGVFTDTPVLVPLPLENAVFENPLLDGNPASLQSQPDRRTFVLVEGRGEHELAFNVIVRIQRQGGWRIVEGKLPAGAASFAVLSIPENDCDLLTGNVLDKRKWSSTKTKRVETPLEAGGEFRWQWRSAISEEGVDRSLEVESAIRVDVQEDGCWVQWTPTLKISRGRWEIIRIRLPKDYVIAEILGENVRGWSVVETTGGAENDFRTVDIELLKPAEKSEALSVRLVKTLDGDAQKADVGIRLNLPKLSIPDAGIHRGRVDLYRATTRTIRVVDSSGLSPTDLPKDNPHTLSKFESASPLGTSIFQSYRFVTEAFAMNLESKAAIHRKSVRFVSVLKITKQETIAETRATIYCDNEPFMGVMTLPRGYRLRSVQVPPGTFWSLEKKDSGDLLSLSCGNAITGHLNVSLEGDFGKARSEDGLTLERLPVFTLENFNTEQNVGHTSSLAILTEPSLDVRAENLVRCDAGNVDTVTQYIEAEDQRKLIRMGLHSGLKDFSGKLVLTQRKPEVRCSTITNVRTTAEAIEETILLDFQIDRAGIRDIAFELPDWMKDAKIDAPFLRRKTVTKSGSDDVLVRLELQEEVMDQLRVLVRADRRLRSETNYGVSVPKIRTGQTTRQYVVLENDRRSPDEMVVSPSGLVNLRALSRQQREWGYLATILGNYVTEAYCSQFSDETAGDTAGLEFRMRRREAVKLSEARIDLAETRIVMGDNGEYRVEQIYRIDNKKEPYLDILLPEDARLWGARLLTSAQWERREQNRRNGRITDDGQPVKPCRMPSGIVAAYPKAKGKSPERLVRIPLIKTETGDLDYVVRLVYAGHLSRFKNLVRLDMPFAEVLNIPVGQSLVRLYLPETYDYRFNGTMQQVQREQENEAMRQAETNYRLQQGNRLEQAAQSDNIYAKARAKRNQVASGWKTLEVDQRGKNQWSGEPLQFETPMQSPGNLVKQGDGTLTLSQANSYSGGTQVRQGDTQMMVTPKVIIQEEEEEALVGTSNPLLMQSQFDKQSNYRANDMVNKKSMKADSSIVNIGGKANFDDNWFAGNELSNTAGEALNRGDGQLDTDGLEFRGNFSPPDSNMPVAEPMSGPEDLGLGGGGRRSYPPGLASSSPPLPPALGKEQAADRSAPARQQMAQQPAPTQQMAQQRNREVVNGQILIGEQSIRGSSSRAEPSTSTPLDPMSARDSQRSYRSGGDNSGEFASRISGSGEVRKEEAESPAFADGDRGGGGAFGFVFVGGGISTDSENGHEMGSQSDGIAIHGNNVTLGRSSKDVLSEELSQGSIYKLPVQNQGEANLDAVTFEGKPLDLSGAVNARLPVTVGGVEPEIALKGLSTRTASLDIEIPLQGNFFLFTTPQGSLDLSLRAVSTDAKERGGMLGLSLLGLLLLYIVYRLCLGLGSRMRFDRRTHRATAALVTLLGVIALLIGAGFAFLVAMILAGILWTSFFKRYARQKPLTEGTL